ncbi:hypothetical protein PoB_005606400 [Plakobranchus ocellatus]|uniref:Uncharacterized protein n=1 Tax=Plakobranchus ocellatus TaxID=259542 RepID=A0AAV4CEJ0_9GAST|nr:hypothetical protein PoB_005606400 [Plakobranchus ocellatus]
MHCVEEKRKTVSRIQRRVRHCNFQFSFAQESKGTPANLVFIRENARHSPFVQHFQRFHQHSVQGPSKFFTCTMATTSLCLHNKDGIMKTCAVKACVFAEFVADPSRLLCLSTAARLNGQDGQCPTRLAEA